MSKPIHRRYLPLLVAFTMLLGLRQASAQLGDQLAAAEQLKSKALEAVRAGKFDLTNDYLAQAAAISKDPVLAKMATWAKQFEQQRQVCLSERHQELDKTIANARLLLSRHMVDYAIEQAAEACSLAADKDAFRREPWVAELLADSKKLAAEFEKNEQWLKALRIYSRLSAIEQEIPDWKEKLKTATRRVRLLALYTPDELKHIQETEVKEPR